MKRVAALTILILAITLRESHGWLPPFLTHRREWWWQEWSFNVVIVVAALAIGAILAGRQK